MADKKISQLDSATSVSSDAVFPISQTVGGTDTTQKATIAQVVGKWLTGTLSVCSTTVTISDASILTTSNIDIYTDVFGVNPTNAVVTSGQIVLTFDAQESAVNVKVKVT